MPVDSGGSRLRYAPALLLPLFTQVPRRGVLGSSRMRMLHSLATARSSPYRRLLAREVHYGVIQRQLVLASRGIQLGAAGEALLPLDEGRVELRLGATPGQFERVEHVRYPVRS